MTQADERPPCPRCGGDHVEPACPGDGGRLAASGPAQAQAQAQALPDPLVGTMVGSFKIQRLLGRGGMGSVYLGEHPIIGSKVAIKFLHEAMCSNPELVGRFYDEARAVNLIGHENIVAIYDLALLPPGRYYIVMEYLDGVQLSALLRDGPLPLPTALAVLQQLCDALRAAHGRGVIHRDLKPENVFLLHRHGREDFVKLVDFGIAKLAGRPSSAHTAAGVIVGTPEFMAPEQVEHGRVDRRTDVYALGAMAYQMVTGRQPFSGEAITQILLAQLREAPRPPRELEPGVPVELEAVILRALAKKPEERYQDMGALGAALELVARAVAAPGAALAPPPVAPAPAAPAPAAPGAARALPEVTVRLPAGEQRRLPASDISRGGLFLGLEGALPAVRSMVALSLPGPAGPVEVRGEVVRHVTAADAARWGMAPGFAVQLTALAPAERQAIEALASATSPAAAPAPAPGQTAAFSLEQLEARAAGGAYELLGLAPGASFPEIRQAGRALRSQLEGLRLRLPPAQSVARVPELLSRLDAALGLLSSPGERLVHDARRGNFQGVAQCVTAGAPLAVVEARRQALLAEQPERGRQAQRHLARAQVATKLGNRAAALSEYEAALTADPLDLEAHRLYWELVRRQDPRSAG